MNKQAQHAKALAYSTFTRNMERRKNFLQLQFHGMQMTRIAQAVRTALAAWGSQ
jgi:hypothetical protein